MKRASQIKRAGKRGLPSRGSGMRKGPEREVGWREAWQRWLPRRNMEGDEAGLSSASQVVAELLGHGVCSYPQSSGNH